MTTTVNIGVKCPNVHKAQVRVEHKDAHGNWVSVESYDVIIGMDFVHTNYLTDIRRVVIEEVPVTPLPSES